MKLWTNCCRSNLITLSNSTNRVIKFNKPTQSRCQIRHAVCPTRSRAKPTARQNLMLNATLRTLQVTVRRLSNSDQHTIRKWMKGRQETLFHWVLVPQLTTTTTTVAIQTKNPKPYFPTNNILTTLTYLLTILCIYLTLTTYLSSLPTTFRPISKT